MRKAAAALYLLGARHLPWSVRPGGRLGLRSRRYLAGLMLDACGQDVNVEHGAWFGSGSGVSLGDRSALGVDSLCMGPVQIGADVLMGPRCVLLANTHEFARADIPVNQQGYRPAKPILIEDDVWIGAGCTILPGRRLGRGSIVGAGAVVTRDVPAGSIVGGNPAKVVGWRDVEAGKRHS